MFFAYHTSFIFLLFAAVGRISDFFSWQVEIVKTSFKCKGKISALWAAE